MKSDSLSFHFSSVLHFISWDLFSELTEASLGCGGEEGVKWSLAIWSPPATHRAKEMALLTMSSAQGPSTCGQ